MYIYESHMGGLFVSEKELSWDEMYCETCGDSDTLIGQADTFDEAWEILKEQTDTFDDSVCENCPHIEDYDYCDYKCKEFEHSGGYNYDYIMKFLYENFEIKEKAYIVLVGFHENYNTMIFSKIKFRKDKNGNQLDNNYELLKVPTITPNSKLGLQSLLYAIDGYIEKSEKYIETVKINGVNYAFYTCKSNENDETMWQESCHYYDGDWYGYVKVDELEKNIVENERQIFNYIKEKIVND